MIHKTFKYKLKEAISYKTGKKYTFVRYKNDRRTYVCEIIFFLFQGPCVATIDYQHQHIICWNEKIAIALQNADLPKSMLVILDDKT